MPNDNATDGSFAGFLQSEARFNIEDGHYVTARPLIVAVVIKSLLPNFMNLVDYHLDFGDVDACRFTSVQSSVYNVSFSISGRLPFLAELSNRKWRSWDSLHHLIPLL